MSELSNFLIRIIAGILLFIQIVSKQIERLYILSFFMIRLIHISHLYLQILNYIEVYMFPPDFLDHHNRKLLAFDGYMTITYCIAIFFGGYFLLYTNKLLHQQIVSLQCFQAHCKILTT